MDETTLRAALQRYWEYAAADSDLAHEIYHDDAILEFPQSQERFERKTNFMAWRKAYPADVEFKIKRIRGQSNTWVVEGSVRYNGGPWNYGLSIHEFRGDKIARETIYFAEGWEAPEWRAPWPAEWEDESLG
jgi:hypothetical protein